MKDPKSLEGMSIEPEERIDLASEGAAERLDAIHEEIEARRPYDPNRLTDVSEEVTAEDELELDEAFAFHDEMRQEDGEFRSPEAWLARRRAETARELVTIAREGGFTPEETAGIAKRFAAKLASEYGALLKTRGRGGETPGKDADEEGIYRHLMQAYEADLGSGEGRAPQETRRIEPRAEPGGPADREDDMTGERAA